MRKQPFVESQDERRGNVRLPAALHAADDHLVHHRRDQRQAERRQPRFHRRLELLDRHRLLAEPRHQVVQQLHQQPPRPLVLLALFQPAGPAIQARHLLPPRQPLRHLHAFEHAIQPLDPLAPCPLGRHSPALLQRHASCHGCSPVACRSRVGPVAQQVAQDSPRIVRLRKNLLFARTGRRRVLVRPHKSPQVPPRLPAPALPAHDPMCQQVILHQVRPVPRYGHQARLQHRSHRIHRPVFHQQPQQRPHQFNQRMVRHAAPLVDEVGDAMRREHRLEDLVVRLQVAHQHRDLPVPKRLALRRHPRQVDDLPRHRLDLRLAIRCRNDVQLCLGLRLVPGPPRRSGSLKQPRFDPPEYRPVPEACPRPAAQHDWLLDLDVRLDKRLPQLLHRLPRAEEQVVWLHRLVPLEHGRVHQQRDLHPPRHLCQPRQRVPLLRGETRKPVYPHPRPAQPPALIEPIRRLRQ